MLTVDNMLPDFSCQYPNHTTYEGLKFDRMFRLFSSRKNDEVDNLANELRDKHGVDIHFEF